MSEKLLINNSDSKLLYNNSLNAMICAIELHNKPLLKYRYETVAILIINAWELIIKAYCLEKDKDIYEKDGKHTKGLTTMLNIVNDILEDFSETIKSIELLSEYRNKYIHFYDEKELDIILYALFAKNIDYYFSFMMKYFVSDKNSFDGLSTLPLCFKINKRPIALAKEILNNENTKAELAEFVKEIVDSVESGCGEKEAIIFDIDIHLQSVKKVKNADLLIGLCDNAETKIALEKKFCISEDKNAASIRLSEEEIFILYPLTYPMLMKKARAQFKFKQNSEKLKKIIKEIKNSQKYSYLRARHPAKKSGEEIFYCDNALEVFECYCEKKEVENEQKDKE